MPALSEGVQAIADALVDAPPDDPGYSTHRTIIVPVKASLDMECRRAVLVAIGSYMEELRAAGFDLHVRSYSGEKLGDDDLERGVAVTWFPDLSAGGDLGSPIGD